MICYIDLGPSDRYPWKIKQNQIGGSTDVTFEQSFKLEDPLFEMGDFSVVF